jgi:ankyrin repeat protein
MLSHLAPPSAPIIETGEVIPRFSVALDPSELELDYSIGKGGHGEVWRGTYRGSAVAIKQFHAKGLTPEKKEEVRKEAAVMAGAGFFSSQLVGLRGLCLKEGRYCLVMDYMPGGDLWHRLFTKKPLSMKEDEKDLPWARRYRIAHDVALGLRALHEHKPSLLHRDLKCLNVLLYEQKSRAKLGDFGLTSLKSAPGEQKQAFNGTAEWAAPELLNPLGIEAENDADIIKIVLSTLEQGVSYTMASDIYSLGMLFWEMATRKMPYIINGQVKADPMQTMRFMFIEGRRERDHIPERCPLEFAQLINDCCAERPDERPTAKEVETRLKIFCDKPLVEAVYRGDEKAVAQFLNEGFSPHTATVDSDTGLSVSLLYAAVKAGQREVVECLLKHKVNVDRGRADDASPLYSAAQKGHTGIAQLLLDSKAAVDKANAKGMTPLWIAVKEGQTDTAKLLLDSKAGIDKAMTNGKTPLHGAAFKGQTKTAKLLLKNQNNNNFIKIFILLVLILIPIIQYKGRTKISKCLLDMEVEVENEKNIYNMASLFYKATESSNIKETVGCLLGADTEVNVLERSLYIAAKNGLTDTAKLLLDSKAAVDKARPNGTTPLYVAAQEGQTETAKLLLDSKAVVDKATTDGQTPLWIAAQQGKTGTAKLLLDSKAAVDKARPDGRTPLYIAAEKGHTNTVKLLLDRKAAIDKADTYGRTPLYSAAQEGHTNTAKLLLDRKAAVDKADTYRRTPLYSAAQEGHTNTAKLLLDRKAAVDKANTDGATPLHSAAKNGQTKTVNLLLNSKAKVNKADTDSWTPLLIAAQNGHTETAKLLLEAKANINKKYGGIFGKTPLKIAEKKGHKSVVDALNQWSKYGRFFSTEIISPGSSHLTKEAVKESKYGPNGLG